MAKKIDYYFATSSPWSYLGHARFSEIARRHGAAVNYKPADAGEIFQVSGGLPVGKRAPQRQAYRLLELKRWRDHLGVPLNLHPQFFPVPGKLAAYTIIAAIQQGENPDALIQCIFSAVWAEERNIEDPVAIQQIVSSSNYENTDFLDRANDPEIAAIYDANTKQAIERQVFGFPSYIIGDEMFWGQDRMDFVERALQQ